MYVGMGLRKNEHGVFVVRIPVPCEHRGRDVQGVKPRAEQAGGDADALSHRRPDVFTLYWQPAAPASEFACDGFIVSLRYALMSQRDSSS